MPQPLLNRSPGSPRPPTRESRRRIVITDTAETSDPGHATAEEFAHPEDGTAYLAMLQRFLDNATAIGGFLGSELRSPKVVRHAIHLLRREGLARTEARLRDTVTSGRSYCRREFRGDEADLLWVPWLLHAGLSPDHASGGLMLPVLAATIHGFGLPVVAGGSRRFAEAFSAPA